MANIYEQAEKFKALLVARERRASSELVRAYALAFQRTRGRIAEITDEIDAARVKGEIISSGWLYERERLSRLALEIEIEMARFSKVAASRVTDEQRAAARLAQNDAVSLITSGNAGGTGLQRLSSEAVEALAGFAGDGSPLRELFAAQGPRIAQLVSRELVAGVAEGAGARIIASRVREVMGGGLGRSLTLARTETLRAYRTVTLESYQANSDVVRKWRWSATLTSRTCAMCWAMHGREFAIQTKMATHPNCRCVLLPVTDATPPAQTGAEVFATLEPGAQREILGIGKYAAFKKGGLTLSDLVGERDDARWGEVRFEKSLREIQS